MKKIKRDLSFGKFGSQYMPIVIMSLLICCLFSHRTFAGGAGDNSDYFAITVRGKVVDDKGEPIVGASIVEKGTNNATVAAADGSFSIVVANERSVLVVTHIGFTPQDVRATSETLLIKMAPVAGAMDSVVVVAYGRQRKATVVGAITQTTGKELERTGGVTNLGMALTGNLPGLVTTSSSGLPGGEDPRILIRAQTTWNNSGDPLILVDGIERPGSLGTLDITSIESISILKDASATAVYGIKGANGVVLITTKRGVAGRPNIRLRSNMTIKTASDLPGIYDAYDALALRNVVILREINEQTQNWAQVRPYPILDKYRNPANTEEWDKYPNVDWQKELFRNSTRAYNASANVSGGSQFVRYFAALDYTYEGDLFKKVQNNRGYTPGYGYQRINMRSNLDFNLSKTTTFTTRLFGSNGVRQKPYGLADGDNWLWKSAYQVSPEAFRPVYSDGTWGYYPSKAFDIPNSLYNLALSGLEKQTSTQITTDFVVDQKLDMVTKGLSARASISLDNSFRENSRGLQEGGSEQRKYIDPISGLVTYEGAPLNTQTDFANQINWSNQAGSVDNGATYRKLNYIAQLNYLRRFGKHEVNGLGLFQRDRTASGGSFPSFREDWVFRANYYYDNRYLFETSGGYNGTEKYGPDYRFQFFPSVSAGWTISNEKFVKDKVPFLDLLKVRASWGRVGDDRAGNRFLYRDQWVLGGNYQFADPSQSPINSPYTFYRISSLGNPNISWETVEKKNLGIEFGFLKGKIAGNIDIFRDVRSDLYIGGNGRAIPSYFGVTAPPANLGKASGKGYEVELRLNHTFRNGLHIGANASVTHAKSMQIFRDDPELLEDYRKEAGHQIGQTRAYQDYGYLKTWDDIYGSTERNSPNMKYAGDYNILDFNADGVIDQADRIPVKYTGSPQNTYNTNFNLDWKGFSMFLQFYAVNNVTRWVNFPTFNSVTNVNVAYKEGIYWTKDNGGGDVPLPRYAGAGHESMEGTRYLYDGSYLRLKNAEIGYTISGKRLSRIGLKSCRIYANGNNLFLWTDMPDDRESNFSNGDGNANNGAYPTMRRFNIGIDVNL